MLACGDHGALTNSATLREQAALARRLAAGLTSPPDRHLLSELADKLEAEAAESDCRTT